MKVLQDLVVRVPPSLSGSFVKKLVASLAGNWQRDAALEERAARGTATAEPFYCFVRDGDSRAPSACLWLAESPVGKYEVTNIVPREVGDLTLDQYNGVLGEFHALILKAIESIPGQQVSVTSADQSVEDWMPSAVAVCLRRFAESANKSTGSAHPQDKRQWNDFLISAHKAQVNLASDRLARWLMEDEGWPPDRAHELGIEFEQGIALLEQYDS